MHVIAAKAVAFKEALTPDFKTCMEQVVKNSRALAQAMMEKGYRIVSGGTDNHLMLVDLTSKGITGKEAEEALDKAGITVNKNGIPFDHRPPQVTSGIRLGTAIVSTRGMKEAEMHEIANLIDRVLSKPTDEENLFSVKPDVKALCDRFPFYRGLLERV